MRTLDSVDASVTAPDVAVIVSMNVLSDFNGSTVVMMVFSSIASTTFVNVATSFCDAMLFVRDRTFVVSTVVAAVPSMGTAPRCETVIKRGIALNSVTFLDDVFSIDEDALSEVT